MSKSAGIVALLLAAAFVRLASAQDVLTVISIDHFRLNLVSGESRHEILPVATIEDGQMQAAREIRRDGGGQNRRRELLRAYPSFQILHRGRSLGNVEVVEIYEQRFHCSELVVGSGEFMSVEALPASDITDPVWARFAGEAVEYETQSFIALSGAVADVRVAGEALVSEVEAEAELASFAEAVASVAPRENLGPLAEDEIRAFRLDRYDAVVVMRKRRSAGMLPGPAGSELPSPLMTDIVVVRNLADDPVVYPLFISTSGTDAWGRGPRDSFIDAFETGDGMAYLAFERRNYEVTAFRLYGLPPIGRPTDAFEVELHGC